MDDLRAPWFILAVLLLFLVLSLEVGSNFFIDAGAAPAAFNNLGTPGIGIAYMGWFDAILLYSVSQMGLALLIPARIHGRILGVINVTFFLLLLIAALIAVVSAVMFLVMMISLLLAVPFGTIAYMAAFAKFNTEAAGITLSMILLLKVGFIVFLVLAQQRFLQMKALVTLILVSLLANVIVSFLHVIGPSFVVSILDALGAIIVGILALLWTLISLIGSVPAVIKALRVDRALASS